MRGVTTGERASAQSHFLDLCAMLGEPGPTQADPTGSWYAFEKGAGKLAGGDGFADVWKRGFFAFEYKGKKKDKRAAYLQLQGYRDALENPPLLVVSGLDTIEIHAALDRAVLAAYGWPDDLAGEPLLAALLALNLERDPA